MCQSRGGDLLIDLCFGHDYSLLACISSGRLEQSVARDSDVSANAQIVKMRWFGVRLVQVFHGQAESKKTVFNPKKVAIDSSRLMAENVLVDCF